MRRPSSACRITRASSGSRLPRVRLSIAARVSMVSRASPRLLSTFRLIGFMSLPSAIIALC